MVEQPTVYVTREIPEPGLTMLKSECDIHVWDGKLPPGKNRIVETLSELQPDGLLCMITDDIDAEVMDASTDLKVISTFSVGYDHIDRGAASERDLPVGHTPGVLSQTTADFAWALLLTVARRTAEGHEYVMSGEWGTWDPTLLLGEDVYGANLGIIGMGEIGTGVARRSAGFNMTVRYSDIEQSEATEAELAESDVEAQYVAQDELLAESDFVSIHVPLFDSTRHLIAEPELRAMKEDAILINASRGPIVDADALDEALENDRISRAGLDVTDPEPLPTDHPLTRHVPEKLVITPHLGSASVQTRNKMATMAASNLLAGLEKEPLPNSAHQD